jgi:drug/metabolite transporter (DMT)-like permease
VLGFGLYYYLMKHLPAVSLAMITVVTPLLALVLGSVLNDERLSVQVWLGVATVCAGLYLNVTHFGRQARRRPRASP